MRGPGNEGYERHWNCKVERVKAKGGKLKESFEDSRRYLNL